MPRRAHECGAILTIVMVAALVCSVLAYGALQLAIAQARRAEGLKGRVQARYAAEAAPIWAMQQLWRDSTWSASATPVPITIPGVSQLTVTFPACPTLPCPPRTMTVVARN